MGAAFVPQRKMDKHKHEGCYGLSCRKQRYLVNDKLLNDFLKRTICQIKIYPLRFIFSSFLPTKKEELFTPPKNYFLCFFLFKKAFGCFFKLISYMYVLWTNFFAFSVFSCCLIASSLPTYAI